MDAPWAASLREQWAAGRRRVGGIAARRASRVERAVALLVRGVALIVALAVFVLLLIVAVPLAIIAAAVTRIRRSLRGLHEPNGRLDGRRNVRVITPDKPV
ncbi:MAG: hypothetical protein ACKVU4_07545 [Phycisphaerales bacterium]